MPGLWSDGVMHTGSINGSPEQIFGIEYELTADAANGSIPDKVTKPTAGFLANVHVVFGTPAPDSLTVTVKDKFGIIIATGTVTASGKIDTVDGTNYAFVPGPLTIQCSGNTTAAAKAKIIPVIFG